MDWYHVSSQVYNLSILLNSNNEVMASESLPWFKAEIHGQIYSISQHDDVFDEYVKTEDGKSESFVNDLNAVMDKSPERKQLAKIPIIYSPEIFEAFKNISCQ